VVCFRQKRPDPIKGKVLELMQVWSHAFRNEPSYKIVHETFTDMKREGQSVGWSVDHSSMLVLLYELDVNHSIRLNSSAAVCVVPRGALPR